jgi:hypothetical protein
MNDDLSTLLYIVFAVIYLLSRVLGKKKKPVTRKPTEETQRQDEFGIPNQPVSQSRPKKPSTFEEIIREFQQAYDQGKKQIDDEDREVVLEEGSSYTPVPEVVKDEVQEVYNKSVKEAKKIKTIDEQVNLEKIEVGTPLVQSTGKRQQKTAGKYARMLQNRQTARDAFIFSEIFNRRY